MNTTATARRSAPRRRMSWRVIDIVTASVLAMVCGVVFWIWSNAVHPVVELATLGFPPALGLMAGGWLFAGILGGLVIRKPGAALYCELVAAAVSALMVTQFGPAVLLSGLIQGIGAELVFLLVGYRRFGVVVSVLSGASAAVFLSVSENIMYNFAWSLQFQLVYAACAVVSGIVLAGVVPWLMTRGLVRTGVLNGVAAGRDARRDRTPRSRVAA
ncbi:ECF transporter S component [Rothia sp. AR01]|uniref:ECF transporter S component n=1 Tax=Rothia santali TaxID=2949643 RepID=A0A9X2KHZ4_9MICC|nr:ECF transporter S component [Rothia santali]MCP3425455.1 ECF transporter S component [Rothia santali]